jgi:dTDP-4-amino-4,6-dideoxygalactose transaminase
VNVTVSAASGQPPVRTDDAKRVPFNRPALAGKELDYIAQAVANAKLSGDGAFTLKCSEWLEQHSGARKALLTHSCTAALEMAALLLDLKPGDEVIMPSFTFVSTANAVVLRGAVPVFVDIRPDTLNLDETLIERAITPRTRAIVPVHYAGVSCAMNEILAIARQHDLAVVEDAAQGLGATYHGRPLGSIGLMGTYSFHETKNIVSGEGGALLINGDEQLALRAEIIREKGTDRGRFFRGEVDKYTWQEVGSSFLPGEIIAAFLWAQLEEIEGINGRRMQAWRHYHAELAGFEAAEKFRRPIIPAGCGHNAHMFYVLVPTAERRTVLLQALANNGINAIFHYVPLHSAPAGKRHGRVEGSLQVTDALSERLIRLPLFPNITLAQQARVLDVLTSLL